MRNLIATLALLAVAAPFAAAQPAGLSDEVREFVELDDDVVALTGVQVVDGTGRAAAGRQTVSSVTAVSPRWGPTRRSRSPPGPGRCPSKGTPSCPASSASTTTRST